MADKMIRTILHISDTHGTHAMMHDLPEADMVVHSGDMTLAGTNDELMDFLNWFIALPYRHKIFIAGNHDMNLYDSVIEGLPENCHYICNSGVTIEGLRFYGVPMFMQDIIGSDQEVCQSDSQNVGQNTGQNTGQNDSQEAEAFVANGCRLDEYCRAIPAGTDVLITHQPPYGILDELGGTYSGDRILLERVQIVKPKLHLFGHVHSSTGQMRIGDTLFSNAAVTDNYCRLCRPPCLLTLG